MPKNPYPDPLPEHFRLFREHFHYSQIYASVTCGILPGDWRAYEGGTKPIPRRTIGKLARAAKRLIDVQRRLASRCQNCGRILTWVNSEQTPTGRGRCLTCHDKIQVRHRDRAYLAKPPYVYDTPEKADTRLLDKLGYNKIK